MFKSLIAPVQMLLLRNGQCVGCGRSLGPGKVIRNSDREREREREREKLIKCKCGRIFVKEEKGYRRASFEEVK